VSEDAEIVAEFESLGDNCEFGFVQRHHGLEPGGLLRWASSITLDGLIRAIECRFAGIYQLDDLAPYTSNMVVDQKYGIAFHTEIHSTVNNQRLEYAVTGAALQAIHREEYEKFSYLAAKLAEALRDGRHIFVYKRNSGLSNGEIARLRQSVDSYGASRLLCVVPAKAGLPAGTIKRIARRTKLASIEKLAPYDNVESALYEQWTAICREAYGQAWD
jgi:hypothetical protein